MNVWTSSAGFSVARHAFRRILGVSALTLLGSGTALFAVPDPDPCPWIHTLDLGRARTTSNPLEGLYAIEIPEPGWLALQSEAGDEAPEVAWLQLIDPPCGNAPNRAYGTHAFLNDALVEVARPGTVYLKMGWVDLDPQRSRREMRLATHLFATSSAVPPSKEGEPGSDTEEEDDEVLPFTDSDEPCVTRTFPAPVRPWGKEGEPGSDTEEEDDEVLPLVGCAARGYLSARDRDLPGKEGEPGSDTEEEDDEVLPFVQPDGGERYPCGNREPMNDLRVCASPVNLDRHIIGAVDSLSVSDFDYYAFTVEKRERVRIVGSGSTELAGRLFDAGGRTLASRGSRDRGFAIDAMLPAGRYYLRIEGKGAGEYRVDFDR